jgi:hypothetical protein
MQRGDESTYTPLQRRRQGGRIGYILLWLIGVPIPVLLIIYFLRGCN